MKKTICALAFLFAAWGTAQKKVDLKASYGTASLFGITESITGNIINAIIAGPSVNYDSNGVFSAEVMMHNDDSKWQYGIGYNFERVKDDHYNYKINFNTFLLQANYTWNNPQNKMKLYSGAGVGALFSSFEGRDNNDNNVYLAFNLSPVGIRYGEKLGVFVEANIGTKGFLQGGASYTF